MEANKGIRLWSAVSAAGLVVTGLLAAGPMAVAAAQPRNPAANAQSTNFAGYAVTASGGGAVTAASSQFVLPSVKCPAKGTFAVLPSVRVLNSARSTYAAGGVYVICDGGTLVLQLFLDVNGHVPSSLKFTPAPGDTISVSVSQTSKRAKVIVRDAAAHDSQTWSGAGGSGVTADIGDGSVLIGGAATGNPPFGSVAFSKAEVDVAPAGKLPHTAYNEATMPSGGTLQILTSKLGPAGDSFTTTYKHA